MTDNKNETRRRHTVARPLAIRAQTREPTNGEKRTEKRRKKDGARWPCGYLFDFLFSIDFDRTRRRRADGQTERGKRQQTRRRTDCGRVGWQQRRCAVTHGNRRRYPRADSVGVEPAAADAKLPCTISRRDPASARRLHCLRVTRRK